MYCGITVSINRWNTTWLLLSSKESRALNSIVKDTHYELSPLLTVFASVQVYNVSTMVHGNCQVIVVASLVVAVVVWKEWGLGWSGIYMLIFYTLYQYSAQWPLC